MSRSHLNRGAEPARGIVVAAAAGLTLVFLPAGAGATERDARAARLPWQPAAAPAPHGSVAASDGDAARDAYELAIYELSLGRHMDAQRRLEGLIAGFPDSAYADAARAKVVELYTATARTAPRSQLGVPPQSAPVATSPAWQVEVHRAPQALDDFRLKVGDRVFFAAGSVELGSRALAVLKAQSDWLKQRPEVSVTIEGHADDPGGADDNHLLAERRADVVRRRLLAEGIAPDRIGLAAHGRERRMALCEEPVCKAQNRRVVSILGVSSARTLVVPGERGPAVPQPSAGIPR